MAFKQLKSSFTASLNGKKREIYAVTPSPIHQLSPIRPSRSAAQGCDRSPIMFLSGHDSDIEPDYHPNSMFNIPRHDQLYGPYSPNSKGVRRLSILEFLQLSVGDEFILFLPPFNKNDNPVWEEVGDRVNKNMRQIIMAPFAKQGTVAERDAAWKKHLLSREAPRDGAAGLEYHTRLCSYPERSQLNINNPPEHEIRYLTNPSVAIGMQLELISYGTSKTCPLRLVDMPFVEAWVPVKDTSVVVEEIKGFKWSNDDNKMHKELVDRFVEAKGDCAAYACILLTYYKQTLYSKKADNKALQKRQKVEDTDQLHQMIQQELEYGRVKTFADKVDAYYKKCFKANVGFIVLRDNLTDDGVITTFYESFKKDFPTVHFTFSAIADSRAFKDADRKQAALEEATPTMHTKQRRIQFLWFAAIRTNTR